MTLRIFNTQTRRKEPFETREPGKVGLYTCGITVYDLCHVGHARSAVVFDVMVRYLRDRGFDVLYVKNFTDVDDKIIARAQREGQDFTTLSRRFIEEHDRDMEALGVLRPTVTPRATEHIAEMLGLVQTLVAKGFAYEMDGDVYFAVDQFPAYGKLSGRNLDEMLAGARIDVNEKKRNPFDFVLWKRSKPGEPAWESPWGSGRPGWHLECSAMSQRYLGDSFDIHGGGEDLVFPHHENEVAQSEGATGKPLARYWVHNGFVRVNSEKMSKSLGNFFTIRDILQQYDPEVLRFFLLQSHYRSPIDFSDAALAEARQGLNRIYTALLALDERQAVPAPSQERSGEPCGQALAGQVETLRERFNEAMDDDFNTARAIGALFEAVRVINAALAEKKAALPPSLLSQAAGRLRETGGVLGLLGRPPAVYLDLDRRREASRRGLEVPRIEALIAERRAARDARDWKRADEIRQSLAAQGVILQDGPAATTWTMP